MNTHADKTTETKSNAIANGVAMHQGALHEATFQIEDDRPETIAQRKMQDAANNSPQAGQLKEIKSLANNGPQVKQLKAVQAIANDRSITPTPPSKKTETISQAKNNMPVQRAISIEEHQVDDGHMLKVKAYIKQLDEAVDKAYQYIMNVPKLGAYATLDGYTEHWVETWDDYLKYGDADLIHAAFGYAIESVATFVYLGQAPDGMLALLQQPRPGTRPDVILIDQYTNEDIAWLDITSDGPNSKGHILSAKTLWEKQPHYGEVTYSALKPQDLISMRKAPGKFDDKIDKHEFIKKRRFAEYLHNIRLNHWTELGKQKFRTPFKTSGGERLLRDIDNRQEIVERMTNYFGVQFNSKMAASVLYTMGIGHKKFGLDDSVSKTYGQSILLNHDPNLPNIPMPKDSIPSSMPMSSEEHNMMLQYNMPPSTQALIPYSSGNMKQETPSFNFKFDTSMFGGFGNQGSSQLPQFNFSGMGGQGTGGSRNEIEPFNRNAEKRAHALKENTMKLLDKVLKIRYFTPKQLSIIEQVLSENAKSPLMQYRMVKALIKDRNGNHFFLEKKLGKKGFAIRRYKLSNQKQKLNSSPQTGFGMGMPMLTQPSTNFDMITEDEEPIEFNPDESLELVAIMTEDQDNLTTFAGNSDTFF